MATLRHVRNTIVSITVSIAATSAVAWPDTAVGDFWDAVGSRPATWADLRYHVKATVHVDRQPYTVELDCYQKGVDKRYLLVTRADSFPLSMRPLPPGPGTEIIIAGPDMLIRNGYTREVRFTRREDVKLGSPPIHRFEPGWEMLPVEPYVYNYMAAALGDACDGVQVTDIDEATRVVVAEFEPALKWIEPHEIAEARWTVDRGRSVVTKFEAIDGGGQVVAVTVFAGLTEVAPGRWAPMGAETVVQPGGVTVLRTRGDEAYETSVRVDGYRMVAEYTWLDQPGLQVPKSKRTADARGAPLLDLEFSDYAVDTGLDDTLFLINPSGAAVDGEPGGDR